jgi:gliding motility-associated-like protein
MLAAGKTHTYVFKINIMKKIFTKGFYLVSVIILLIGATLSVHAGPAPGFSNTTVETGGLYTALAKDASGNIYVTRVTAGTSGATYEVDKYTNGTGSPVAIITGLTHQIGDYPFGLAVDSHGNVFVATDFTTASGKILKLTFSGGIYTPSTYQTGRFFTALAIDASDNLYSTEYDGSAHYAVVKYAAGSPALATGTQLYDNLTKAAGYTYPTGLTVAPNGDVYVADAFSNTPSVTDGGHIFKLTAASSYAVSTVSSGNYATALGVDASGNLYSIENNGISTSGYKMFEYINGTGTANPLFTPLHTNGIYYPFGIAVITSNDIFVNDGDDGTHGGSLLHLTMPTTINSINRVTSQVTNATSVQFTATFGAAETGVQASNFHIAEAGGISGSTISSVTGSGTTYTITVAVGTAGISDGTLGLNLNNTTGLSEGVTNSLPFAGQTYTIDKTAPTISISAPSASLTKGGPITYTVTYADANFNASTLATGNITLNTSGTATGSLAVTGSGLTRTVTISSITGDGTLGISIAAGTATDLATNLAPAAGPSTTFTVDNTAPTISISAPSASSTVSGPITYTVTYADANFNSSTLSTGNITLNTTGGATGSIAVTGSGLTRTVTISSITGTGTLGISIPSGTATDLAGNSAPAAGPSATFTTGVVLATDATLSNLVPVIGTFSPTFSPGTLSYTVNVANNVNVMAVTPTTNDPNATAKTGGVVVPNGTLSPYFPLKVGANSFKLNVFAQDGVTKISYTINVNRSSLSPDDNLANLSVSGVAITPTFSSSVFAYFATVPFATTSVTVTPATEDATATVTVNGTPVTSGSPSSAIALTQGLNTITIVTTAQDGITVRTSTISIVRSPGATDATLSNLVPVIGTFSPTFSPGTLSYTVNVANNVNVMAVTPTTNDPNATARTGGVVVPDGTLSPYFPLKVGANSFKLNVFAQDGVTKISYTININRSSLSPDANLANLSVSGVAISPAFSQATRDYFARVPFTTTSVTVTPTTEDATATVTVNGTPVTSGSASSTIALLNPGPNTITIVSTAQDGITTLTYTATVIRAPALANADLSAIYPNGQTLTPGFTPGTTSYTISVANNVTSVSIVNIVPADVNAMIQLNGVPYSSGDPDAIFPGSNVGSNISTILVTAQDGTIKTYTVNISRAAPSGLNSRYQTISVNPTDSLRLANADVIVHPAVSPNGDGINDFLYIENIQNHPENKVTLINRSGAVIYEMSGYDNYAKVFNGHSSISGNMIQPGTYYYLVEYSQNGENKRKTGFFVLK